MIHDIEVGYLVVEVPEPASLDAFFGEIVGLVPGQPATPGGAAWRNDGKAYRLLVEEGPANDATVVGIEAVDADSFERCCHRIAAAGYPLADGTAEQVASRRVTALRETVTPWGTHVEIVHGLAGAGAPFRSPLMRAGFLTDGVGFGHVVFATTEWDDSHRFVTTALGMQQSDWLEMEIAKGVQLEVRFYHCNERHHSIALAKAPFALPQKLHHLMLETNDRDDVGAAFDRVWASDLAIPNGLGRHDNDGMFSFYVASPAGFQVEVGHGARIVTDDWDDNRRYDRISAWGHQSLRST